MTDIDTARPNTINWLSAILRKAHCAVNEASGNEIDVGMEVLSIRREYDALKAANERLRKVLAFVIAEDDDERMVKAARAALEGEP